MRRFIWPSLIWLLALALPIQGLAAATMVNCAVGHEGHGAAPATAAANAAVHHAHGADVARQAHEHGAGASDHHAADHSGAPILHKCSACAACGMGLALPSTDSSAAALPLAATVALPAPMAQAVAFLTGGPDRPPRALHA